MHGDRKAFSTKGCYCQGLLIRNPAFQLRSMTENPQPETRNPHPATRISELETRNPKLTLRQSRILIVPQSFILHKDNPARIHVYPTVIVCSNNNSGTGQADAVQQFHQVAACIGI